MAAPFNVPLPAPGDKPWNLNPAVEEVRSRIGAVNDLTTTGRLGEEALNNMFAPARTVDMLAEGAAADGTTSDWAAFTAARTKAGAKGIVRFPAKKGASTTTYFIGGTRPDLSGTQISVDPGVVLKMDAAPEIATFNFITPVTIENTAHGTTRALGNIPGTDPAVVSAANVQPDAFTVAPVDLTNLTPFACDATSSAITETTPTATVAANLLSWGAAFAAGVEGLLMPVTGDIIGKLYEIFVEDAGSSSSASFALTMISTDNYLMRAAVGKGTAAHSVSGATSFTGLSANPFTIASPDGQFNIPHAQGGAKVGFRLRSVREVEWYVNDKLVQRFTTAKDIGRIGWTVNATGSATMTAKDTLVYTDRVPFAGRQLTVSVIGDSLSDKKGTWNLTDWTRLLPIALAGLPGGGEVTVRQNVALSGTTAVDWASTGGTVSIQDYTFTGDDYVAVLLGTNDGGVLTSVSDYITAITSIANYITAQGARPVFGIFPFWWISVQTGITGVSKSYGAASERLRAALAYFCAQNGYPMALVRDVTSTMKRWTADNVHGGEMFVAAVARAFAQSIARDQQRVVPTPGWGPWSLVPASWYANAWVSDVTPQYRVHADGRVQWRGAIKSGAVGAAALNIPAHLRPATVLRKLALSLNGTTPTMGAAVISNTGTVTFYGVDNTRVALDDLTWTR